jgi:hypothetical protein
MGQQICDLLTLQTHPRGCSDGKAKSAGRCFAEGSLLNTRCCAVLENCPRNIQARGEQFLAKLMEKQAEKDASQANKEAAQS